MLLIRSSSGLRLIVALVLGAALLAMLSSMATPAVAQNLTEQEAEQDAESGDTDQSGKVSNTGDNANQCVGVQPVSNTGNAETQVDIIIETPAGHQYNKRFDLKDLVDELDLDLEDIGSSIEIAPEMTVECAQEVQQAATAANDTTSLTASDASSYWAWDDGWWYYDGTDGSWWAYDDGYGYTSYSDGYWYADVGGWWYYDSSGWWWWDGYYWTAYGAYNTVSNVATGALDAAQERSMPLAILGSIALLGTAGVLIRRNRGRV